MLGALLYISEALEELNDAVYKHLAEEECLHIRIHRVTSLNRYHFKRLMGYTDYGREKTLVRV